MGKKSRRKPGARSTRDTTTTSEAPAASPKSDAPDTQKKPPRKWLRRLTVAALVIGAILSTWGFSYFWYRDQQVAELEVTCKEAFEAEDWEELERSALEWFRWQPEKPRPLLYAAQAASARGSDRRTALYLYKLPDSNDPATIRGLLELSHLQFGDLNQPIAGAETCERILRIMPEHQEAHRRLIYYYVMTRQRTRIIEEARRAIREGGDVPATYLYLFGADWMAFTNGREVNSYWLQSGGKSEMFTVAAALHYVRSAVLDQETVETDETGANRLERVMLELIEQYPKNLEVLSYHLDLACFRGQLNRAIELLKQAPPESLDDSRFWGFKGWIHEQREEWDEAEQAYVKALEMYPYASQVHHWLAALYRRMGKKDQAAKFQAASVVGKNIMRDGLQIPNTESITSDLLASMHEYADLTGDGLVATRLAERLAEMEAAPSSEATRGSANGTETPRRQDGDR